MPPENIKKPGRFSRVFRSQENVTLGANGLRIVTKACVRPSKHLVRYSKSCDIHMAIAFLQKSLRANRFSLNVLKMWSSSFAKRFPCILQKCKENF